MTIIRLARDERARFTVVSNLTVEDPRLSFKALGLLVYLLSKSDDWRTSVEQLAGSHADGEFAVRGAMKELEAAGYVTREGQERDAEGRLGRAELIVHEHPVGAETALPSRGNRATEPAVTRPAETAPNQQLVGTPKTERPKNRATPAGPALFAHDATPAENDNGGTPDAHDIAHAAWGTIVATTGRRPMGGNFLGFRAMVSRQLLAGTDPAVLAAVLPTMPAFTDAAFDMAVAKYKPANSRPPARQVTEDRTTAGRVKL